MKWRLLVADVAVPRLVPGDLTLPGSFAAPDKAIRRRAHFCLAKSGTFGQTARKLRGECDRGSVLTLRLPFSSRLACFL